MEAWIVPALHDTSRGPVPEQFVYICALPLYHVFALVVNCLFGMRHRHAQRADHEPARHRRFRQATWRSTSSTCFRASTRSTTRCARTRSSASSISRACASRTAAAWRCRRRSRTSGGRSPACRSSRATGCPRPRPSRPATRSSTREYNGTIGMPFPNTEIADPRRCRTAGAARPAGRDRDPRAAGHGRLLEPAGRDREGHDRPTVSSSRATSASWTSAVTSGSSIARRT